MRRRTPRWLTDLFRAPPGTPDLRARLGTERLERRVVPTTYATSLALVSGANPSPPGTPVSFTATLTATDPFFGSPFTPPPGAGITFTDNGAFFGSGSTDAFGTVTVTDFSLTPGSHTITASFGGGSPNGFDFYTASGNSLTQIVGNPPPPAAIDFGPPPVVPAAQRLYAVGADAGGAPLVKAYNGDGTLRFNVTAYDPSFTGGVRVAVADVDGDGTPDVVTVPGPGGGPLVNVYSGLDGSLIRSFLGFDPNFRGGLNVAAGDLDRDGHADIVLSADQGGGPRVQVVSGRTAGVLSDFFGINDVNFRGGARVAVGDINNDGDPDLVVAAGFGGGSRVAIYNGQTVGSGPAPSSLVPDFFAFEPGLRNGVYVSAGDVNGDGFADLIAGAGPGGAPRVIALSGVGLTQSGGNQPSYLADFFAGDPNGRGGVRVATADVTGTGGDAILTGTGPGGETVTAYPGTGGQPLATTDAFAGFGGGVYVDGAPSASDQRLIPPSGVGPNVEPNLRPGEATAQLLQGESNEIDHEIQNLEAVKAQAGGAVDTTADENALQGVKTTLDNAVGQIRNVQNGVQPSANIMGTTVTSADLVRSDYSVAGGNTSALSSPEAVGQLVNNLITSTGEQIQNTFTQAESRFNAVAGYLGPVGAAGSLMMHYMSNMGQIIGGLIRLAPDFASGHTTPANVAAAFGSFVTSPIIKAANAKAEEALNSMVGKLAAKITTNGAAVIENLNSLLGYVHSFDSSTPGSFGSAILDWLKELAPPPPPPPPPPPSNDPDDDDDDDGDTTY